MHYLEDLQTDLCPCYAQLRFLDLDDPFIINRAPLESRILNIQVLPFKQTSNKSLIGLQRIRSAVADSGFPRQGCTYPSVWAENLLFGKILVENCVKMKEIALRGRGP